MSTPLSQAFVSPVKILVGSAICVLALTACTAAPAATTNSTSSSAAPASVTWCITEPQKEKVCYLPVDLSKDESAYQTFVELDRREDSINFNATDYGDSGYFVTSINNVAGDSTHFWKLFTNDVEAQVGISSIKPQDKDTLEFKYEAVQ